MHVITRADDVTDLEPADDRAIWSRVGGKSWLEPADRLPEDVHITALICSRHATYGSLLIAGRADGCGDISGRFLKRPRCYLARVPWSARRPARRPGAMRGKRIIHLAALASHKEFPV
jgi:hypothetical protein